MRVSRRRTGGKRVGARGGRGVAKRSRRLAESRARRLRLMRVGLVVGGLGLLSAAAAGLALVSESALSSQPQWCFLQLRVSGVDADTALGWLAGLGIEPGDPLSGVDLSELRTLLRRHPEVRDVVLRRCPAEAELYVGVSWHEPVAAVAGRRLCGISRTGVVISHGHGELDPDLPVITGVDPALVHPGECIACPTVKRALSALELYERTPSARHLPLSEIHIDSRQIVMYTVGDATQILLPESDTAAAIRRLDAVMTDLRRRGTSADYIDLRFRRPVVRPRDDGTYRDSDA